MKRITTLISLLFSFCMIFADSEVTLFEQPGTLPNVETLNWNFNSNSYNDSSSVFYRYEAEDIWGEPSLDEFFPDRRILSYKMKSDSIALCYYNDKNYNFKLDVDSAYFTVSNPKEFSFSAIERRKDSVLMEGKFSWTPGVEGVMNLASDFSCPAKMSTERIDYTLRNVAVSDVCAPHVSPDTLKQYSLIIYRWMIDGRQWPAAVMTVDEVKDANNVLLSKVTHVYCARKEWITGIWKTEPRDIDVIVINKEGFEFYLPGGCEAVEVDVRVTAQDGADYGTAHFNIMPAESYFMKVPGMTQGVYSIYVTVKGETFENKRTIR